MQYLHIETALMHFHTLRLLKYYLLNTSFNAHNEPIIDSPEHAFVHLNNGIIDKLVIEDYVYYN